MYRFNLLLSNLKYQNKWTNTLFKRCLSTPGTGVLVNKSPILNDEDRKRFDGVFPPIVNSLSSDVDSNLRPIMGHLKRALEYNVPHGKKQRGLLTVATYKLLATKQSDEQFFKACILGWCTELLQAVFLVSDDISDNSLTRRGQPCWYRQPDVGLSFAIIDTLILECGIYTLLQKYFREEDFYADILDLFHDTTKQTMNGQLLDLHYAKQGLDFATQETYDAICINKTAMYSFYLPVALGMHMVGIRDKGVLEKTKSILIQIGQLFQIQDDYLDCFGNPDETGKIGTDIQEGKCTWLIVNALKLVNREDYKLLKKYYGKNDPEMVRLVFNKYVELQLDRVFTEYEKETYESLTANISELPPSVPADIFRYCLQLLYRRQK